MKSLRFLLLFGILVLLNACFLNTSISQIGQESGLSTTPPIEGLQIPEVLEVEEGDSATVTISYSSPQKATKSFLYSTSSVSASESINYTSASGNISISESQYTFSATVQTHEVGITNASSLDFKLSWFDSDGVFLGQTLIKIKPKSQFKMIHQTKPHLAGSFNFINMGSYFLFSKTTPESGAELWRSDGTTGGTFLVRDICAGVCSSSPENFVKVGSSVFFIALQNNKQVIFKSDGTTVGTEKIFDFSQVTNSPNPNSEMLAPFNSCINNDPKNCRTQTLLIASSSRIFFILRNVDDSDASNVRVMSSQGTIATTFIMDTDDDLPYDMIAFNDRLFVSREDDVVLWLGSASGSGKTLIRPSAGYNCTGGPNQSILSGSYLFSLCLDWNGYNRKILRIDSGFNLVNSTFTETTTLLDGGFGNGFIYYSYYSAPNYYLKRTDGTGGGTVSLFNRGTDSTLYPIGKVGTTAIFTNSTGFLKSDGTAGTTSLVKNMGSVVTGLGTSGSVFYFALNSVGGVYSSDLTSSGTIELLSPDAEHFSNATPLFSNGTTVYFSASTPTRGIELWKVESTGNPILVTETRSGAVSSWPGTVVDLMGTHYFTAATDTGSQLYQVTQSPSALVPHPLSPYDGGILETLYSVRTDGTDLYWTQQSTLGESSLFKYSNSLGAQAIAAIDLYTQPRTNILAIKNGKALIQAISNFFGYSSPSAIVDVNNQTVLNISGAGQYALTGNQDSLPTGFVYKAHPSSEHFNLEPYFLDFSTGTSTLLSDIVTGFSGSNPFFIGNIGSLSYFIAGASGSRTLYKTDGTPAGTISIKNINSYNEASVRKFGSKIIFGASTSAEGSELWITDGTSAGTTIIKDIVTGSLSGYPIPNNENSIVFKGKLYFQGSDTGVSTGEELWVTDGTNSGTFLVKDICSGTCSSLPNYFFTDGNDIYFWTLAENPNSSNSTWSVLWKSDGTSSGTIQVADIRPLGVSITPVATSKSQIFSVYNYVTDDGVNRLYRFKPSVYSTPTLVPGYDGILPSLLGVWEDSAIVVDKKLDGTGGVFLTK